MREYENANANRRKFNQDVEKTALFLTFEVEVRWRENKCAASTMTAGGAGTGAYYCKPQGVDSVEIIKVPPGPPAPMNR